VKTGTGRYTARRWTFLLEYGLFTVFIFFPKKGIVQ